MGSDFMENFMQTHATNLGAWALLVIFFAVFTQTFNPIGALIPGTPMLFLFGLMSHTVPGLSFGTVLAAMALGGFSGSAFAYGTGRFFGDRSKKFSIYEAKLRGFFDRFGSRSVFVAYYLPFVRNVLPMFAGVVRTPLVPFLALSFAGALSWSLIVGGCGYFFGGVPWVRENLDLAILGGGILMALGLLTRAVLLKYRRAAHEVSGAGEKSPQHPGTNHQRAAHEVSGAGEK
jgi:membrane-associated protein